MKRGRPQIQIEKIQERVPKSRTGYGEDLGVVAETAEIFHLISESPERTSRVKVMEDGNAHATILSWSFQISTLN